MSKLAIVTRSSVGRAAIGFFGTSLVLLGTMAFEQGAQAATFAVAMHAKLG